MKKIFTLITILAVTLGLAAQTPEQISYQAVVRDANNELITNQSVGIQVSILQGDANGSAVFEETHVPTSNVNGLVNFKIGTGTAVSGDFSLIDWSAGPYFVKIEIDPAGGTSYSITSTSQLLSVPYALHAKIAESVSGGVEEADPVFIGSEAANITATDISNLGNLSGTNTGDQDMSGIVTNTQAIKDTAVNIRSDLASVATTGNYEDLLNAPDLSDTSSYADQAALEDTASQIRDDLPTNNNQLTNGAGYLTSETDPNVPNGTQAGEMQYWNGSEWITVAAGSEGQVLTFKDGVPVWLFLTPKLVAGEVFNPTTGEIWMDKNLGASQVATSSTDAASYGDLYQWGRGTDGHESRTSGTTSTLATSDTPGHGDFIISGSFPNDWRSPQNDNLWQGVSGTNNPCPSGYRLPTEAEWEAERTTWSSNNAAGAFASTLKLPAAGNRNYSSGALNGVGSNGGYWSSTIGLDSRYLLFYSSFADMYSEVRARGLSVRCIKD